MSAIATRPQRPRPAPTHADSYDNIEPWFDKLAACDPDDAARGELREYIVQLCLPLAEHIARRYSGRGLDYDDLEQVARLGVVEAVDRFDIDRGTSFLSFAVPTIMGEVRRHFRDYGWAIRVPRRTKEIQQRLRPVTDALAQQLGRQPTARELADELGVDLVEVTRAFIADNSYRPDSLDTPVQNSEDSTPQSIGDMLGADDPGFELTEDAMAVGPLIAELPERERSILIMRFFESRTQADIAERVGVSQMQISRIVANTLTTLRTRALKEPEPALGPVRR